MLGERQTFRSFSYVVQDMVCFALGLWCHWDFQGRNFPIEMESDGVTLQWCDKY